MKTPNDFDGQDYWKAHLQAIVAPEDASFRLAVGRYDMFKEFYSLRGKDFPKEYSNEFDRVASLSEPLRTEAMDALNGSIFEDMIQFLFTAVAPAVSAEGTSYPTTAREIIHELQQHLKDSNPYFALWIHYQGAVAQQDGAPQWHEFVRQTLENVDAEDIDFAVLMGDLARCLDLYYQRELTLPKHFYFQIWFLYRSQGPERNPMTRALVQELVEGLDACASA